MDRRDFFKTLFATPFLTPILLSAGSERRALQLYAIGDSPQLFLPSLLRGLREHGFVRGRTFTFLNSHPELNKLRSALSVNGWNLAAPTSNADFSISFNNLRHKASPSFALIKNGKVWDIRTQELYSLWKDMHVNHPASSWITTVFFKDTGTRAVPGTHARVYLDGTNRGSLSLDKNLSCAFRAEKGKISLVVHNRRVWVPDSSCRHKICSSVSPISLTGERIICAPNNFLVEIQGPRAVDTIIG